MTVSVEGIECEKGYVTELQGRGESCTPMNPESGRFDWKWQGAHVAKHLSLSCHLKNFG